MCIGVAAGRRVMHTRSYLLYKPVMACPISALETVKMMWLFLVYAIFDFYLNDIVRFFAAVVGTPSPTGSPGRPNACSCNEKARKHNSPKFHEKQRRPSGLNDAGNFLYHSSCIGVNDWLSHVAQSNSQELVTAFRSPGKKL